MARKDEQKAAGLTLASVTGLTFGIETGLTPEVDRPRRPYKPRRRRCACGCGQWVTPTRRNPNKRFYDDVCRKRYSRRQAAKQRPPRPAPTLALMVCQFCGDTFLGVEGKGGKYCKGAHRTAAAECRREAAIDAVTAIMGGMGGTTGQDVINFIEREGMKKVSRYLKQQGWLYDETARRWHQLTASDPPN